MHIQKPEGCFNEKGCYRSPDAMKFENKTLALKPSIGQEYNGAKGCIKFFIEFQCNTAILSSFAFGFQTTRPITV